MTTSRTAKITFFGIQRQVSPATAKKFMFTYLPVFFALAAFNWYLLTDAAAYRLGWSFGWTAVLAFVLLFNATLNSPKGDKEYGLLPKPWIRTILGYVVLANALVYAYQMQSHWQFNYLVGFAAYSQLNKFGSWVRARKAARAATAPTPGTKVVTDVTDVKFRDVSH